MKEKLILVQLNEINFDILKSYLDREQLKNFQKIYNQIISTKSENEYNLLEPWIQWYSIYTGLKAKEHNVFRLGDVEKLNYEHEQIFELLEKKGLKIGAITPMNAKNKCKNPAYFISDPWTKTKNAGDSSADLISEVISEFVNNNSSSKIGIKYFLYLFYIFFKFVRFKRFYTFFILFLKSIKKKWYRSIFLDLLIHEIHLKYYNSNNPNFSSVFFNAGAHIQHHYFFNCILFSESNQKNPNWYLNNNDDPFKDIIKIYDLILEDYLDFEKKGINIILCTGLSQEPNNDKEFYYRLTNHKNFLEKLDIKFSNILPRMSRDFLVEFENLNDLDKAYDILSRLKINDSNLFGLIEKRNKSLFVSLTYKNEITANTILDYRDIKINLNNEVSFVAIKNGQHSSKGYIYLSNNFNFSKKSNLDIVEIFKIIQNFFDKKNLKNEF